jgi:RNA polymerase sigma-70 factor (ECF subfamily)
VSHSTDHELLERTCRGDSAGAREFWSRFGPAMLAYARAVLRRHGGEPAAADAVQTVLCRLLELDHGAVAAVADVPAFLLRSTRHAALNLIRSADRARAREAGHGPAPTGVAATPEDAASASPAMAAIETLDEEAREVVILKHIAGLTFDQIALALDQNRNTVAARYRRAVEGLRARAHTLSREAHHV